jgi:tetrahydromethanopterin S-methyltransferase subunit C
VEPGVPTKLIATLFALAGFAVAALAGLSVGNQGVTVLPQAGVCMIACYVVGYMIGSIGESTVRAHVDDVYSKKISAAAASKAAETDRENAQASSALPTEARVGQAA